MGLLLLRPTLLLGLLLLSAVAFASHQEDNERLALASVNWSDDASGHAFAGPRNDEVTANNKHLHTKLYTLAQHHASARSLYNTDRRDLLRIRTSTADASYRRFYQSENRQLEHDQEESRWENRRTKEHGNIFARPVLIRATDSTKRTKGTKGSKKAAKVAENNPPSAASKTNKGLSKSKEVKGSAKFVKGSKKEISKGSSKLQIKGSSSQKIGGMKSSAPSSPMQTMNGSKDAPKSIGGPKGIGSPKGVGAANGAGSNKADKLTKGGDSISSKKTKGSKMVKGTSKGVSGTSKSIKGIKGINGSKSFKNTSKSIDGSKSIKAIKGSKMLKGNGKVTKGSKGAKGSSKQDNVKVPSSAPKNAPSTRAPVIMRPPQPNIQPTPPRIPSIPTPPPTRLPTIPTNNPTRTPTVPTPRPTKQPSAVDSQNPAAIDSTAPAVAR